MTAYLQLILEIKMPKKYLKVDVMLGKEIPELMKLIQKEEAQAVAKQKTEAPIKGVWNINMVITLTSYFV